MHYFYQNGEVGVNNETAQNHLSVFSKVTQIWGYFYCHTPRESWNSDGVIEQWEFPDTTLAQKALSYITNKGISSMLYFNTQPYFARFENSLYIFHSRASAFSYDQQAVFDKFIATIPKE